MMKTKIFAVALCLMLTTSFMIGCGNKGSGAYKADKMENDVKLEKGDTVAVMQVEGFGDIKIKLYKDIAPKAVENFTTHAENGYYDGLIFHRVMDDFMIQGGDPTGTGMEGESIWGEPFEDEFSPDASNFTGALSMANSGQNTNGSQFFIVNGPPIPQEAFGEDSGFSQEAIDTYVKRGGSPHLDYKHTVFGMVYSGMDVVNKIMDVEVIAENEGDPETTPKEPVVIKTIDIYTVE